MRPGELSRFERAAIEKLVSGDQEEQLLLRQLDSANVLDRKYSGRGVFVHLGISKDAPPIRIMPDRHIQEVPTVGLMHPHLRHGGGLVLFLKDGLMDVLECYTFDEDWPKNEDLFEVVPMEIGTDRILH